MKTRYGRRGVAAPSRSARRITGARRQSGGRGSILALLALCLLVLGSIAGFAWQMERQLNRGLLRQWEQARTRPDWVPLERLPRYVPQAILTAVDPDFLRRRALPGSFPADRTSLPGELVRQLYTLGTGLGDDARALAMEPLLKTHLSRRQTLEFYLNRVYFGRSGGVPVYGIFHAAREFVGKPPGELTPGEAATLAGLLLPPRIRDPERRPGAVGARRNEVLQELHASGLIGTDATRRAMAERLAFQPGLTHTPMSRPAGWDRPPVVILLPAATADSAAAP